MPKYSKSVIRGLFYNFKFVNVYVQGFFVKHIDHHVGKDAIAVTVGDTSSDYDCGRAPLASAIFKVDAGVAIPNKNVMA